MSKFKIGWAEVSLVPDKKVYLAGQLYERVSEYVESEITVTAMAIKSENEQAIIVSCDATSFASNVINLAREKFAKLNSEVAPEKLVIGTTHTHTSIKHALNKVTAAVKILDEFMPPEKKYKPLVDEDDSVLCGQEALDFITDKIAIAANKAWENLDDAMYANAFGRAAVGFCRRVCYNDGSALMWGDTNKGDFTALEGGNDSGIELLYIFDTNKKLTGIVANIACPSQILEHRSFISSDFWGKAKERLRKEFGEEIYLLAMCGAGGDQCPRDLIRWVEPETPINDPQIERKNVIERVADPSMFDLSGCRLVGKRIANEIISVYEEITEIKDEIEFAHEKLVLDLPLRKATPSEYKTAVREVQYYVDKNADKKDFNFEDKAAMHVYVGTIRRYRDQQTKEIVPTEVHIIRFGDVAIATNPFELFLDYGNYIKARSFAKQTFIMQLTCGALGYLPTEKAVKGGHYSAYITSGNIGPDGGDILARKTVEQINKLFE